ncbi:MAG: VacJ family lipoprotein [Rhodobacter sp.]|nr:VacJ family lipoprotein [Paracoccaceae bacterium]MCB1410759.1 VacJ family lipoprotein [Paracoccaceae bacterium]MCC0081334.1 VacJ family lipoprotein [Rhodobacter sp.]
MAKVLAFGAALLVAACGHAPVSSAVNDPHEAVNRVWFQRNLALAGAVTRGDSAPADTALEAPDAPPARHPVRHALGNFGANLGLPGTILNDLLQLRPDHATENALRLLINTTIGLGGLFDPASRLGVHGRTSDFGETLHRWGAPEGAYVVLPVFGPSTERDALGLVVDTVMDPMRLILPASREYNVSVGARLAGRFANAAEYSDLLDANVINTADPYAQARLLYLQTRRYHLGIQAEDEIIDPYADF